MSVGGVFPLILFGISIIFTTLLFLSKNKKLNLNEIRKTIREDSEKAIKSLEQKVVETEELVSLKQADAQDTCGFVERKIQELRDDGEELNQLGDALNKYRSMLAQLNLATSQAQAFVVRTNNDAKKLQELQLVIDSHEKKTYAILQSYDSGIKQQHFQLEAIKTEITSQTENSINQIVTTRDESLSEVRVQIEKYQALSDRCDEVQSTHKGILNELIERQAANKANLNALNKEFEDKCDNYLNETKNKLDEYLTQIQTSANDKLSLLEGSIVKNFEMELNREKEETLLGIDDVLTASIQTISLYDEKINKSYENFEIKSSKNDGKKDRKDKKDIKSHNDNPVTDLQASNTKPVDEIIITSLNKDDGELITLKEDDQSGSIKKNEILEKNTKESIDGKITSNLLEGRLDESQILEKKAESPKETSKKESKLKKKKRPRNKKNKKNEDEIEIMAGIDLIDMASGKVSSRLDDFVDDLDPFIFDEEKPFDDKVLLDDKVPRAIGDINLDDLASIDASFCEHVKKEIKDDESTATQINEADTKIDKQVEPSTIGGEEVSLNENKKDENNKNENKKDDSIEKNSHKKSENLNKKNLEINKEEHILKKLNGTGFGNLLDSYGSSKRIDDGKATKDSVNSFKPGSIIERLTDEDKLIDNDDDKALEKDSSKGESLAKKEKDIDADKKKKSGFVVIGEEEEILLD